MLVEIQEFGIKKTYDGFSTRNFIAIVKAFRQITGLGLDESRVAIESKKFSISAKYAKRMEEVLKNEGAVFTITPEPGDDTIEPPKQTPEDWGELVAGREQDVLVDELKKWLGSYGYTYNYDLQQIVRV